MNKQKSISKKPSGVMKGSSTMATKGDKMGKEKPVANPKVKIMAKVMKVLSGQTKGANQVGKVIGNNTSARDKGKALSLAGKRKMKTTQG